jgi:hypothetical protein
MDSSLHFPKVVKYEMAEAFASLQLVKRKSLFGPAPTESQVEFPEVPSQLRTEAAVCLSGNLDQVQRDREFFRTHQKLRRNPDMVFGSFVPNGEIITLD